MNAFETLDIHLKIPDLWQQDALHLVKEGKDVVVNAPTGAGKTYLVELIAESYKHGQIVLAVPTRALANDKLREFRAKGWRVGIVTGDVTQDPEAPLVVATLETQKPRFLRGSGPRLFVIDEYQMIGDAVRGVSYELCVALAPPQTQLLMLSGSVSNPQDIVDWLARIGRDARLIALNERPVPLEEVYLDALSYNPPRSVTGFWPRLIAKALMADLGPILVFAPQRKGAESLARQLSAALPLENPMPLSSEQKRIAGVPFAKMLANRVAYHHSGLSYQQRAGLVEPLAKAGQLRIVVSTTGLAAGVNFSMRSVLVTESQYSQGGFAQPIEADELLQMFGRAGRRGFDSVGYALVAPDRPRLREGKQRPVRRANLLDWPSLLSLLDAASVRGEEPFPAAVSLCQRLLTSREVLLGVEHCIQYPDMDCGLHVDAERARHAKANSEQIKNARGDWELRGELRKAKWGVARARRGDEWTDALSSFHVARSIGEGKTVRLAGTERFGKKRMLGYRDRRREDHIRLAAWLQQAFADARLTVEKLQPLAGLAALPWASLPGCGSLIEAKREGARHFGYFDLAELEGLFDIDSEGTVLWEPEIRRDYPAECVSCPQLQVCETELSPARSAALAWRQLQLIEKDGQPTRRGRIFGFFQGGEGLAIAAALEDESYAVDAIARDLANLRAGYRFDDFAQYSHRLSRACRVAYQDRTYEGYLQHGLPLHYGEGAAEVIADWEESAGKGKRLLNEELRYGDVQRARREWLSLLRRIAQAPPLDCARWSELQACARAELAMREETLLVEALPELAPSQRSRPSHLLRFPRKW